ncbi:MAG: CHAT domain-containing tetratricopeptide repeat protein [Pseudomonadota bacterium]
MRMYRHLFGLFCLFLLPCLVHAEDTPPNLTVLNDATLEALQSGDAGAAVTSARTAVEAGRSLQNPDPTQFAYALNNLGFVLSLDPETADEALQWLGDAIAFSDPLDTIDPWALAMANRITLHSAQGNFANAEADATELVNRARATPWYGRALGTASSLYFENGRIIDATDLFHELIAVDPGLLQASFGAVFTAYAGAQEDAEATGRTDDAIALLDARIALLRQYMPGEADEFSQTLLWQKYYQQFQADRFGDVADTLREIGQTGALSAEKMDFVDEMATLSLQATQLSGYTERREVQLPYAQMGLAFAELIGVPDDPRLGLALREVAAAEQNLGRLSEASLTLQQSLSVLAATADGSQSVHLVFTDLALNAQLRSDYALAEQLYAQAEQAYQAALTTGAEPLSLMDEVITITNRAELLNEVQRYDEALALIDIAWGKFREDEARGAQKWNSKSQATRLYMTQAVAQSALGRGDEAIESISASVAVARDVLPATHPDLSLILANASDALFVEGRVDLGLPFLEEAVEINRQALPDSAPLVADAQSKLAFVTLFQGDRDKALGLLRTVAQARKSPAYQDRLSETGYEFETLAWLLLDAPGEKTPDVVDEALSAIQWTQVTRSAQALAMMETRLSQEDPAHSFWLRRRQDIQEEHARNFSRLLAAYAEDGASDRVAPLEARHLDLELDLASTEETLASFGLETAGITGVNPLSVADIQARLKQHEAIVTFLLPGLIPDVIPGLEVSSNHAIAITPATVSVARIPDYSRGSLNQRITAFRCQVAVSDPGCLNSPAAALRGAMLLDDEPDEADFDYESAHQLYHDLFVGVESALSDTDHLMIVPPADLLRLPFHALVTSEPEGDSGKTDWLIRRHAISVLPSLASLRALRPEAPSTAPSEDQGLGRLLGMGDPIIGTTGRVDCEAVRVADLRSAAGVETDLMQTDATGFALAQVDALRALPRLADAECELTAIDAQFDQGQSSIFLGEDATEDRIKTLNQSGALADYSVLVFATHGLTAGEAGASAPGLVLTPPDMASPENDGLLTAAEIAALTLNARLVVLSACNTAAGESPDAEGMSGLARAFFHAGGQNLLVTHWSVYSAAAVEISTGLFQELGARPDQTHASALRRSMLAVLDDPAAGTFRKHPSYWAAFAIVGAN